MWNTNTLLFRLRSFYKYGVQPKLPPFIVLLLSPLHRVLLSFPNSDLPYHTTCATPKQTDPYAVLRIYRR
jgi:hypothetical protein